MAPLVLASALSRGFAAAVEQLPPADAPLLAAICAVVAMTVAVALALPARRALSRQIRDARRDG
jgi:hypothetical protein